MSVVYIFTVSKELKFLHPSAEDSGCLGSPLPRTLLLAQKKLGLMA